LNPVEGVVTSEALCARIAGDGVAGMVLHRLLMWLPKSRRADGGIWKSDKEMASETGFSYTQLRRARTTLAGVVISKVKRAMGSPTMHYWLNEDGFVKALAGVVKRSVIFVRSLLKMDFEKTLETVTTESPNKENQNQKDISSKSKESVMESAESEKPALMTKTQRILVEAGVNQKLAEDWKNLDPNEIQAYMAVAQDKVAEGQVRSVAGYLVGTIRKMMVLPGSVEDAPEDYITPEYARFMTFDRGEVGVMA
jgi:hypothetical protein